MDEVNARDEHGGPPSVASAPRTPEMPATAGQRLGDRQASQRPPVRLGVPVRTIFAERRCLAHRRALATTMWIEESRRSVRGAAIRP